MRLLVVSISPPQSSRSCSPNRIQVPQPPTPGLPLHAPSVHISTVGGCPRQDSLVTVGDNGRMSRKHESGGNTPAIHALLEAGIPHTLHPYEHDATSKLSLRDRGGHRAGPGP